MRPHIENIKVSKMKLFRTAIAVTLEDISNMSGLDIAHLSRIERGIIKPTQKTKVKISNAVGLSVDTLFEEGIEQMTWN